MHTLNGLGLSRLPAVSYRGSHSYKPCPCNGLRIRIKLWDIGTFSGNILSLLGAIRKTRGVFYGHSTQFATRSGSASHST